MVQTLADSFFLCFPASPAHRRCPSSNQIKARWRPAGDAWQARLMALAVSLGLCSSDALAGSVARWPSSFDGAGVVVFKAEIKPPGLLSQTGRF
jgi:hypothetical protein